MKRLFLLPIVLFISILFGCATTKGPITIPQPENIQISTPVADVVVLMCAGNSNHCHPVTVKKGMFNEEHHGTEWFYADEYEDIITGYDVQIQNRPRETDDIPHMNIIIRVCDYSGQCTGMLIQKGLLNPEFYKDSWMYLEDYNQILKEIQEEMMKEEKRRNGIHFNPEDYPGGYGV